MAHLRLRKFIHLDNPETLQSHITNYPFHAFMDIKTHGLILADDLTEHYQGGKRSRTQIFHFFRYIS